MLGASARIPASPEEAVLERVPNPHPGTPYLVRFTAPEFTSLCPMTGQPDFAHLVIDYVPRDWLVESKSLKLYLTSFRNHGAFHEAVTVGIARRLSRSCGRSGCASAATGIRAAASRSTSSTSPASPPPASGSRPRMSPATAAAAEPARAARRAADPRAEIRAHALSLGFDAVGFARAELAPEARERLMRFLAEGMHGSMGWMEARAEQRAHPRALWPEAVSVISLGTSYAPEDDPLATLSRPERGTISVYARHRDYHDLIKGRLKRLGQWMAHRFAGTGLKVFVDTAPVMEKPLAQQAGLGWQGKHTNLVSRDHGSWLFLGEVFTTLDLTPDEAGTDHCGSCTRCLTACPTGAFPAPYRLDARRCISYLTIEHRGPIPHDLRPRWATASMAATTAWPCAPGTSSPMPTPNPPSRRGRSFRRRASPTSRGWTMRASARSSRAAR
jgi:epoxyqueuosine reductase